MPDRAAGRPADPSLEERFDGSYRAHYPAVIAYLRRRLPADDVADVAAEVFSVAWKNAAKFDGNIPLPWLYGVAYKKTSERYRGRRRQRDLAERLTRQRRFDATDTADAVVAYERNERVQQALDGLPVRDREIIRLVVLEELSYEQTAEALGVSTATVRTNLFRARKRLKSVLAGGTE